jgi:hypothetical protein
MASGLPVVAVVDEDNFPGFRLVDGRELAISRPDPADLAGHLAELLGNGARRTTVAAGGRCLILDHFQISSVARAYVSLYEGIRYA